MSLNAWERETLVSMNDGDDFVVILTGQRKWLNRLKKHPKAVLIREFVESETEWGEFRLPADQYSPITGIKRNSAPLSPERRAAMAARLAAARAVK